MYQAKNNPQKLLESVGFVKARDRGWHIIIKENALPFDEHNHHTWAPRERLHATYFEQWINIHYDAAIGRNKHKTLQRHSKVLGVIEQIKHLDNVILYIGAENN